MADHAPPQADEARPAPPEPDSEAELRRREALRFVRTFGDPVLKSKALPVTEFDGALREEISHLAGLMRDAIGVGLAATQVGVMHRALVYRVGHEAPLVALVNPELEWSSREQETAEEGCLSLPGVAVDVERPLHVRVHGLDGAGEGVLIEASGLEARVIQHEMDHLDGILILDRTTREQRKEAIRTLREGPPAPDGDHPRAQAETAPAA